jgi:hypothetical protein
VSNIRVLTAEPQGEGIVELLEKLLSEAREGALSSAAIAVVDREGCTRSAWSTAPSTPLLIGAVAQLQHCLLEGEE